MSTSCRRLLRFMTSLILAGGIILVVGCGEEGPSESGEPDAERADSLVSLAGDSLGKVMDEMINQTLENLDSTFRPSDIDFTGVLSLYEQALVCDPSNNDARFGAAFTGLMSFLADPTLNDLYERFKNVIDTGGVFPTSRLPEITLGRAAEIEGVPATPGGFTKVLTDFVRLDAQLVKVAASDPTIGEIQELLETSLLPKITTAESRLQAVISIPGYEFIITPQMQGNPGASPIELDRADFRVILASLHALEAAIHIFVARDLNLPSYTIEGVEEALQQESDFLSLKPNNVSKNHMSAAKTDILTAEGQLEQAVDDLLAEISSGEDQTDDLIKVYPEDEEDLDMIKDSLSYYRSYFNGPKEFEVIWYTGDSCWEVDPWYWECVSLYDTLELTVDISEFFDNPIDNPKNLLPGYTLTISSNESAHKDFAALHFSREAYWDSLQSIYGVSYPDDTLQSLEQYGFSGHLPDEDNEEFYEMLADYNQSIFGWDDLGSWWYGSPYIWDYYSNNKYEYQDHYYSRNDWVVCYEWTATTFEAWTWPNPTFNGLFPGMTSHRIKNEILGMDPEDWTRSDCGTF